MEFPSNLDLDTRARLLSYLVVSHLVSKRLTGDWLSAQHVVESMRLWLAKIGDDSDWLQRILLASYSKDVAKIIAARSPNKFDWERVPFLFCEDLRLDLQSPVVHDIYFECFHHLVKKGCGE
ncbi:MULTISPECIES: hypothetical protein [Paraburkholderia]|uniref:hypothetical protein n=1 Tax=Paraburkholderia TaxID=1822464 RepID=UPI00225B838A|nr:MULTISPECIES: hypothetical protein [Paraburkholderia]MCX4159663.1 hypothetical protein [Paraburkholderia aspalathi]MDN7169061.1 hypothetical protein [Paraburkholderia sp. SECH2]MDQ6397548.1 hypothetical protein [Paraburkholderia aspalathi]